MSLFYAGKTGHSKSHLADIVAIIYTEFAFLAIDHTKIGSAKALVTPSSRWLLLHRQISLQLLEVVCKTSILVCRSITCAFMGRQSCIAGPRKNLDKVRVFSRLSGRRSRPLNSARSRCRCAPLYNSLLIELHLPARCKFHMRK